MADNTLIGAITVSLVTLFITGIVAVTVYQMDLNAKIVAAKTCEQAVLLGAGRATSQRILFDACGQTDR